MKRVYNFSAGPATLPLPVLEEIQDELLDFDGSGMSIMEMSHRTKTFDKVIEEAEQDLRDLLKIPSNYKVLFMQGGASTQFACVPLNLMKNMKGDYIVSGEFSNKAYKEGCLFGDCQIIASSKEDNFSHIPSLEDLPIREDADYVHICENNTIYGTKYHELPDTKGKPLVADQSSCFLSEPIDVSKYGVIYAGVQKNVGPAGLAIVIVREDLIRDTLSLPTPTMLNWKVMAESKSLYNTPNCFAIYACGKVFKYIKSIGGLEEMKKRNMEKANLLYDYLDSSKYVACARKDSRSMMNVTFRTGSDELDALFVEEAKKHNIISIKGHRAVGGMRASIYNAMPKEGIIALIEFMKEFEKEHL